MGQQQLLLLVLGIVIVGLAVVVGLQAFGENQKKANADALVNDALSIAADVQAWSLKPSVFGGGEGDYTGLSFERLGYTTGDQSGGDTAADDGYESPNGVFTLTVGAADEVTVVGCSTGESNTVTAVVGQDGPDDIVTTAENGTC